MNEERNAVPPHIKRAVKTCWPQPSGGEAGVGKQSVQGGQCAESWGESCEEWGRRRQEEEGREKGEEEGEEEEACEREEGEEEGREEEACEREEGRVTGSPWH